MRNGNMRKAYGETLSQLGAAMPSLVVLEADLGKSTMGAMFAERFPARYFDLGIAEANMISVAAGMALTGYTPFASSFAVFATGRCYDQIRASVCIAGLNVKIAGSSAGLSDYGDGATHQSIDDIALMRALPNMQVFVPCDAAQAAGVLTYMAQHAGPMYIRITRSIDPILTEAGAPFVPGRVQIMRPGRDGTIVACGTMVARALEAADILSRSGHDVRVVNAPSVKPLDVAAVRSFATEGPVVVAEEHSVIGGLGDAVSASLEDVPSARMRRVGIEDLFGQSARDYGTLMAAYGLTSEHVAQVTLRLLDGRQPQGACVKEV